MVKKMFYSQFICRHPNILPLLALEEETNKMGETTQINGLLEMADGNLLSLLKKVGPPLSSEDVF